MVTITLETPRPLQLTGELQRQVPFALSLGINNSVKAGQRAIQERVMRAFIVRRTQWISQSIKITKFSTKTDLETVLQVDPTRNVLGKFEPGGIKTARKPGGTVAVPAAARDTPRSVIPAARRPKAFRFQYAGKGPKGTVFKGRDRTFLVKRPGGQGAIFQRVGPGPQGIQLLYVLAKRARIPARLQFKQTGLDVIRQRWPREYRAALFRALRTAR